MKRISAPIRGSVLTLMILAAGCSLDKPGLPTWTIEVRVPFSARTYRLSELITDSARFADRGWGIMPDSSTDGTLRFEYIDTLDTQWIGDRLTYDPTNPKRFRNRVGVMSLESTFPVETQIRTSSLLSDTIDGYTGIVPPFEFTDLPVTLEYNILDWARFRSGDLVVAVRNGTQFDLEDLTVTYYNTVYDSSLIGFMRFEGVLARNAEAQRAMSINDQFITGTVLVRVSGRSPGRDDVITVRGDSSLVVRSHLSESLVDSAKAEFRTFQVELPDTIDSESRNKLQRALIHSGWAVVEMKNTMQFKVTSTNRFDRILDPLGRELTQTRVLRPGTQAEPYMDLDSINLAGCLVQMSDSASDTSYLTDQKLHITNTSIFEDTRETRYEGNTRQVLAYNDGLDITYWTGDLVFDEFTGMVDSVVVDLTPSSQRLDLPSGLQPINFADDSALFHIDYQAYIPMFVDATIKGINESDPSQNLTLEIKKLLFPNSERTIRISNIDSLLRRSPDVIEVGGTVTLGREALKLADLDTTFLPHFVTRDDTINSYMEIKTSLELSINGDATLVADPQLLSGQLDYPVEEVELNLGLVNSIPLSGQVRFLAGTDTNAMDTLAVVAIPRGALYDKRASAVDTFYTIRLDSRGIETITAEGVYTRQVITLESTDSLIIQLRGSDTLLVNADGIITYKVDFKGINGD